MKKETSNKQGWWEGAKVSSGNSEMWDFEKNPEFYGKILEFGENEGKFGISKFMRCQDTEGNSWTVFMPTVLESKIANLQAKVGEEVGIKYLGVPHGKRYKDFLVGIREPLDRDIPI
jgi:hypothetical protein